MGKTATCEVIVGAINFNDNVLPSYIKDGGRAAVSVKEGALNVKASAGNNNDNTRVMMDLAYMGAIFANPEVEYMAFDLKLPMDFDTTNGKLSTIYYQDYGYPGKEGKANWVQYYATHSTYETGMGYYTTYYFPRAAYESYITYNAGSAGGRFINIGKGILETSEGFYIDNIRGVSAEEKAELQSWYSFEYGGIRNNSTQALLYTHAETGTWQLNINNIDASTAKFTNDIVSHGNTAIQFKKKSGTSTLVLNHTADTVIEKELRKAGYITYDLYVPEGANTSLMENGSGIYETLQPGWHTIYAKVDATDNTICKFWDTTCSTYVIDNIRLITEDEYNAEMLSLEGTVGVLRDQTAADTSVAYIYAPRDSLATRWTFVVSSTTTDTKITNLHYDTENVHDGEKSLAFHKTNGYIYFGLNTGGEMYSLLKNGFSFWIYADLDEHSAINVLGTSNFVSGTGAKFASLQQNISTKTWMKITVNADEINTSGRFLIIQGSTAGTYYIDRLKPLESYEVTYDAGVGTVGNASVSLEYGDPYTLETPTYNAYFYEFLGWYNGNELVPMSGDKWAIKGDVTLTARYSEKDVSSNFYNSNGEIDTDGSINALTLEGGTHNAGSGLMPIAATHTSDMAYYRFGGDYGLNDFAVLEFTGNNMPIFSFFTENLTNSIYNHAQSADEKAWIFFNGIWNGAAPDGDLVGNLTNRLNWIGPYKITYKADNTGSENPSSTRGSDGSTPANPNPISLGALNANSSSDQYRMIIGWVENGSNMSLRIVVWNLTTGNTYDAKVASVEKATWEGDIALYGHFGRETVLDKVYPIEENTDIETLKAKYLPAITTYKASRNGNGLTLTAGTYKSTPQRPTPGSVDMSYIAFNGNYGYNDYVVFDFTGDNMPIISFGNDKVTNSVFNNKTSTGSNSDPTSGTGVLDTNATGIVWFNGFYTGTNTLLGGDESVHNKRFSLLGSQKVLSFDDDSNKNAGGFRATLPASSGAQPISIYALKSVTETYRMIIGFDASTKKLQMCAINMVTGKIVYEYDWSFGNHALPEGSIALHGRFGETTVLDTVFGVEEDTTMSALKAKYAKDTDYSDEEAVTLDRYGYSSITDGTYKLDGVKYCSTCGKTMESAHADGIPCKNFKEDQATYDTYAEAGFNIMLPQDAFDLSVATWATQGVTYMDKAQAAGLKVILTDHQLQCLSEPLVVKTVDGKKQIAVYSTDFRPWVLKDDTSAKATAYKALLDSLQISYDEYTKVQLDIKVRNELAVYKDHPAFYGVMLGDEPTYHNAYCYGELYKSIKRVMPECYVQYNLNPLQHDSAEMIQLYYDGTVYSSTPTAAQTEAAYKNYLLAFIDSMGINYIQYDDYPFKWSTDSVLGFAYNEDPYVDPTALRNIQLVAEIAKERDLDVKVVTQSCLMLSGKYQYTYIRQINEDDARWLNNYLMGFGVKQINYFTYWTKAANSSTGESFVDGGSFVNKNGTTTEVYDIMKTIMAENTAFAPTISYFDYSESQIFGNNTNGNLNCAHVNWNNGILKTKKSFKWLSNVTESSGNGYTLVTELYDDEHYNYMYMLMNTVDPYEQYAQKRNCTQSVTVTLDSKVASFYVYQPNGSRTLVTGNTYTVSLTAGQAIYIMPAQING